jgi:hypothetical protein
MAVELEDLLDGTSLERSGATFRRAALTGDVTATAGSNATTIAANAVTTAKILDANVTLAKLADLAQATVIGRASGAGTGVPTALSAAQLSAIVAAGGSGDVVGPASSTDNAFARFDGATGKLLQDATGATLDDAGRAVLKALRIPLSDAGNSGAAKTIDWNDSNEQLLTLTDNVTLTLSNPGDGGRYVLVLLQDGTGGRTVTWPAAVKWPAGSTPTITATASRYDIVTLIYLSGAGIYLASINQNYSA